MFWAQFAVIIIALCFGARFGGVFMGMAGGVGLGVLVFVFHLAPSSPPIDVMLIIIAVVLAAATLQACGGMDYLVQIAEGILRKNPSRITFVAPIVTYVFTFLAGTGNVAFSVIPVIAEVARESGVRPERPLSISIIASQQAITASPISAAMAALVALLMPFNIGMASIMMIAVPATILGVFAGACYSCRVGKELHEDPEYQRRLAQGLISPPSQRKETVITQQAKVSVVLFVFGAFLIVLLGTVPSLRPDFVLNGATTKLAMTHTIEMVMMIVAAAMVIFCRPNLDAIVSGSVFKSGMMGVVCIFGLAWMGDTLVSNHMPYIRENVKEVVTTYPWMFAIGMMLVSALVLSQAATTRLLMPLGIALGLPPAALIASWPACNGYFLIPSYATLIAGVAFDTTGTTKIGKYVFNHSYMIPGLITCFVSVTSGFVISSLIL
ncbi:anaerobic C4-dicarboxylate transporter [Xanthobacteraceae bacterium Astr-EGSB]|uniref:anaerobic C4-dicarboxylate transporter family protein n=1 Tax=Astrobacterium formosum TaxID=3069710 RepID=UPI0027B3C0B3|nr:anaerobic C4-dicarboxylate transporter [Xanthobacteraceae bacterium Astr-EGSB]